MDGKTHVENRYAVPYAIFLPTGLLSA